MKSKTGKTLKNLLYTASIITLGTFLPMKSANGQITKTQNIRMKEANRLMNGMERPNTLYIGFQPIDLGLSLGYSRKITPKFGAYSFLSKGNYMLPPNFFSEDIEDSRVGHIKIAMGGIIYTAIDARGKAFILAGPTYNFYNKKDYKPGTINEKAFRKLSFEFGAGATIGRIGTGVLFNTFQGESNIFLNFSF